MRRKARAPPESLPLPLLKVPSNWVAAPTKSADYLTIYTNDHSICWELRTTTELLSNVDNQPPCKDSTVEGNLSAESNVVNFQYNTRNEAYNVNPHYHQRLACNVKFAGSSWKCTPVIKWFLLLAIIPVFENTLHTEGGAFLMVAKSSTRRSKSELNLKTTPCRRHLHV